MHELGIVFHIINEIEDVGKEMSLKRYRLLRLK